MCDICTYSCCTYSYTYSYICTCSYTCVYAWVQRPDKGVGCLPPSLPSYTLRLHLLRNLGLIGWASCLAGQRGPRTRLSSLLNASVTDMLQCPTFTCKLGIHTQGFMLAWQALHRLSHLPTHYCYLNRIAVKNSVEVNSLPKFIEH